MKINQQFSQIQKYPTRDSFSYKDSNLTSIIQIDGNDIPVKRIASAPIEIQDANERLEAQYKLLQEEFDKHIRQVNNFKASLQTKLTPNLEEQFVSALKLYKIIQQNQYEFLNYFEKFLIHNQEIEKININSFINYLYISISKKLNNNYDIAIDEYGRIVIYYSENKRNRNSRKISIIVNENDFIFSILSRKNSLGKLSSVCVLAYPDAYHKFDSALRGFDGY